MDVSQNDNLKKSSKKLKSTVITGNKDTTINIEKNKDSRNTSKNITLTATISLAATLSLGAAGTAGYLLHENTQKTNQILNLQKNIDKVEFEYWRRRKSELEVEIDKWEALKELPNLKEQISRHIKVLQDNLIIAKEILSKYNMEGKK